MDLNRPKAIDKSLPRNIKNKVHSHRITGAMSAWVMCRLATRTMNSTRRCWSLSVSRRWAERAAKVPRDAEEAFAVGH